MELDAATRESLGPRTGHPSHWLDAQKKTLSASEQNPEARAAFRARLEQCRSEDVVVIDECGSNINLTRRYARAPRGVRAVGSIPRNTPPNTTLIASITLAGIGPSMLLEGATDRLAFEAYIEHILAPTLRRGQIVILDNLSAHHSKRVEQLITARGCELWFLPSYSPDFSPIEPAFAKLKSGWRKAGARSVDELYEVVSTSLSSVTAADAHSFFTNCGFRFA